MTPSVATRSRMVSRDKGLAFTANLTLTTRGNKQSILILSPGTEVPEVTITLDKQ
jgi:hypothetical protein